jgi:hypothetical protein
MSASRALPSSLLYCCFTAALLLLYCCFLAAFLAPFLLLSCGFTAALLLLFCCFSAALLAPLKPIPTRPRRVRTKRNSGQPLNPSPETPPLCSFTYICKKKVIYMYCCFAAALLLLGSRQPLSPSPETPPLCSSIAVVKQQ